MKAVAMDLPRRKTRLTMWKKNITFGAFLQGICVLLGMMLVEGIPNTGRGLWASGTTSRFDPMELKRIANAHERNAICADGSAGGYYLRRNSESNNWVVAVMGGGGCKNLEDCEMRLKSFPWLFGISDERVYPNKTMGLSLISPDEKENPAFSTWNHAFIIFCSQDIWLGDAPASESTGGLHFRGVPIFKAAMEEIWVSWKPDSHILLAGVSAGGIALMNHWQWVSKSAPTISEVSVLIDSSWFINYRGYMDNIPLDFQNLEALASCLTKWNGAPCCAQASCLLEKNYFQLTNSSNLPGHASVANLVIVASAFDAFEIQNQDPSRFTSFSDAFWELGVLGGSMNFDVKRSIHALKASGSVTFYVPNCFGHGYLPLAAPDLAPCYIGKSEIENITGININLQCSKEEKFKEIASPEFTSMILGISNEESGLGVEIVSSYESASSLVVNGTSLTTTIEEWMMQRRDETCGASIRLLSDECTGINCNPTCPWKIGIFYLRLSNGELWIIVFLGVITSLSLASIINKGGNEKDSHLLFYIMVYSTAIGLVAGFFVSVNVLLSGKKFRKYLQEEQKKITEMKPIPLSNENYSSSNSSYEKFDDTQQHCQSRICMTFQDLNYWPTYSPNLLDEDNELAINSEKSPKPILNSISGYFLPFEISAIMGPTGSGKTTLLEVLTGRCTHGIYSGTVHVNEDHIDDVREDFIFNSGYARQFSTPCFDTLTVFENLAYAALFRLNSSTPQSDACEAASEVIRKCCLQSVASTLVGKISGGENRRLAVAVELLKRPGILFLDEPTSGLDSTSTLEFMSAIQGVAQAGCNIIMTIHQPRQEVFSKVNRVMVLKNGKQVYYGARQDCENFISAHYIETEISTFSTTSNNMADIIMDLISNQDEEPPEVSDFRECLSHDVEMCMRMLRERSENIAVSELKQNNTEYGFSIWWDRVCFQVWRTHHAAFSKAMGVPIIMFLGSVLVAMCFTVDPGPIHYAALLFLLNGFPPFLLNGTVINRLCGGYKTFYHENMDGCYSVTEYLAQNSIANACFTTGVTAISAGIQFLIGLKKLHSLNNFFIVMTLTLAHTQICVSAFTMLGIIKNYDRSSALVMGATIHSAWQLAAGFIMPLATMPQAICQLKWLSVTFYTYGSMILSLFEDLHFDCSPGKSQVLCLEREGASIINYLEFQGLSLSFSVAMLWFAWFGLYAASLVILISPWKAHKVMHIKYHASTISGHFNLSLMKNCRDNHSCIGRSRSLSPLLSSKRNKTRRTEPRIHSKAIKRVPNLQVEIGGAEEMMAERYNYPSLETSESGSSLESGFSFEPPIIPFSPGSPCSPTTPREVAMKNFMDCATSVEPRKIRLRKPNYTRRMSTGIKENAEIAIKLISHVFSSNETTEVHDMDGM